MTTLPRLIYDLPVDLRMSDGRTIRCRSRDIDAVGITIKSPYIADVGARFTLRFNVLVGSTPHLITTDAVVTHCYLASGGDQFHIHLHFKEPDPQQLRYIEAFIRERKRG